MLRDECREHLTQKILPFWEKLKDGTHGGFYGYVDKYLTVDRKADKGCILNSRILWTFSTAARMLKDDVYRSYADWAYDEMKRFEDPAHGGVFWGITFDGKPSDTTKHTYCQAFAIYGLAAYYRLTGKREALEKAISLYRLIEEKCWDGNGYGEAYKADFSPESGAERSANGGMAGSTRDTHRHGREG